MSFYIYTEVYDLITNHLERFHDKWAAYKFYMEPFLEGSEDIIGVFSDTGLFIFFHLNPELPGRFRMEESNKKNVISLSVNPNNFMTTKEFEFLLLENLLKWNSFREKMKYGIR